MPDTTPLTDCDSIDSSFGSPTYRVGFDAGAPSVDVEVIALIVEDGAYRVASSSTCPNQRFVLGFAAAWARCAKFIAANSLTPRSS